MHRLDEHIAEWKQQMAQADSVSQQDLSELEQHLYDSVADLQKRGLNENEAFLIASTRLGPNHALTTEYSKVNGSYLWRRRVFWMLAGYLVVRLAGAWIGMCSSVATVIATYAGIHGTVTGIIDVSVTCIGWVALLAALYALAMLGGPRFSQLLSQFSNPVIACCVLGAIAGGAVMTMAGRMLTVRLATVEEIGQSAVVSATASLVLQILLPVICLLMMWALRRSGDGIVPQQN